MRLAWFSPMPPVRSGIATCSAELVAALSGEHEVDVYVDSGVANPAADTAAASNREALAEASAGQAQLQHHGVRSAHDFVWRQRQHPYDLTVYQLGNSSHHDYLWPYLFRYPGLVVLHDAHLHHARAAALLRTGRAGDYRAEFAANHPDASADAAELAVAGFDNHLYYSWPMRRLVVLASRMTAVHAPPIADALRQECAGRAIESIRLGHGVLVGAEAVADARARVRRERGIPSDALLFGVCGGLTPDKRIPQILDALAHVLASVPSAHLLLAGAPPRHYDLAADVQARGLGPHVTLTCYIDSDEDLTAHLAACDVSLNLRWPTAREMSGPWLRALAAGRPTIVMDLAHLTDIPSLDPRTWTVNYAAPRDSRSAVRNWGGNTGAGTTEGGPGTAESQPRTAESGSRTAESDAVTVAIDILDEDHSLRLAMRRLAGDADLRARLGTAGQRYWQREHSLNAMLGDYHRLLPLAAARPVPPVELPAHLVNDGGTRLRLLGRALGLGGALGERSIPGLLE